MLDNDHIADASIFAKLVMIGEIRFSNGTKTHQLNIEHAAIASSSRCPHAERFQEEVK